MRDSLGKAELWRRMALLFGVLVGLALFFYVAPAMVSITAVDWELTQAGELDSITGYVSEEEQRLSQLPLSEYIREQTEGKLTRVTGNQWPQFFMDVQLASSGEYERSPYGKRVSEKDKDSFWIASGPVEVFFKPEEIPTREWGLRPHDGADAYISIHTQRSMQYLHLRYHDYNSSITAMSAPYRVAPGWLLHPYRNVGIAVIAMGFILYLGIPRRKKDGEDISYSTGSMFASDLAAGILLLPFYGLPFLINGGTVQALTGMWVISLLMWILALLCIVLLYYNAYYASYRIGLTEESLRLISFKGLREISFREVEQVNLISLRNPGWFRKLSLAMAFFSMMGGGASTQPAGSAMLTASAVYGGLEIQTGTGKPLYIWFTNQNGSVIIRNFEKVIKAMEKEGIAVNWKARTLEGFSMFL